MIVRKTFKLRDLDCANCAAKMECGIQKIEGVENASVSFMTQKLILEADDERFDAIVEEAARICKRIEPDCEIVR
jgi:copper chaperone CopZ